MTCATATQSGASMEGRSKIAAENRRLFLDTVVAETATKANTATVKTAPASGR